MDGKIIGANLAPFIFIITRVITNSRRLMRSFISKNTRIINCTIDWMKRRKGETNIHPLRRDQKTKPQGKQRLELSLASACIKPGTQKWLNVYPVETIHTAYAMM